MSQRTRHVLRHDFETCINKPPKTCLKARIETRVDPCLETYPETQQVYLSV